MDIHAHLHHFREKVKALFRQRGDAARDLVDALTVAGHIASPVALSEALPFRRKFSMVYDVLEHADLDPDALGQLLYETQPPDGALVAGFEVYAVDGTKNERPDAATLPERELLKTDKDAPACPGWRFSWLVRLV